MDSAIYDIVVIGGGPGGISAIVEAKTNGFEKILLIEKGDNHSQTIRKFYKENKRVDKSYKGLPSTTEGAISFDDGTKESTLNYFDSLLDNNEIDFVFNCEVESVKKNDGLFRIVTPTKVCKAKNVIIAIGRMGKPNRPNYKIPISIKNLVNFNLESCSQGEKILVVGGGNSAAEYAIELSEINTVTLAYRKDKFTRLNEINEKILFEFNGQEKLRLRLGADILSIENESGKIKVNFNDGYYTVYDRVIYAIGGTTPIDFLNKCEIKLDEIGNPVCDENYQTSVEGLYLSGDLALKLGGSIVAAINHSYRIVQNIIKYDN